MTKHLIWNASCGYHHLIYESSLMNKNKKGSKEGAGLQIFKNGVNFIKGAKCEENYI